MRNRSTAMLGAGAIVVAVAIAGVALAVSRRSAPRSVVANHPVATPAATNATPGATSLRAPTAPATHAPATPTTAPAISSDANPCGTAAAPPPQYQHVIWIWMENRQYSAIIGNAAAPYITGLSGHCASDSNWHDAGSQFDSEPNYMAMTTGLPATALTPYGCDCAPSPSVSTTEDNIFRQVRIAGHSERSYAEGMSGNCSSMGNDYAAKHNPALYMWGAGDRSACRADDIPMGSNTAGTFIDDLHNNTLPAFAAVIPNLQNDMHDSVAAVGDAFLRVLVPQILNSQAYRSGTTALMIVWDEDTPIPNVVIAPSVHPGAVSSTPVSHYGLLRGTEEMLGLPLLGEAASATSIRGVFHL